MFISGLEKNKVFKWKNSYEPLHQFCEGTSWSVHIATNEGNYFFEGNSEYPKEWSKFCKNIRLLIIDEFS
ncbi:MAG: hypothetical protein ACI8WT_002969 [Clostridium sp.]